MSIIFLTCTVMFVVGVICLIYSKTHLYSDADVTGGMLMFISALMLIISVLCCGANRIDVRGHLAEYEAVRQTVYAARENNRPIESAAMQTKIADINAEIASLKYYNTHWFDMAIPDDVDSIEPIR